MKKSFHLLLCLLLLLGAFPIGAYAAEPCSVHIGETFLPNNIIKLEFSISGAQDVYGVSLDLSYDATKLDIVTAAGAPAVVPVVSTPGFFGPGITDKNLSEVSGDAVIGDAYTAVNQISGSTIHFVRLLAGSREGIDRTTKAIFAEAYFKVKSGQTFGSFSDFVLVQTAAEVTAPGMLHLKVLDAQGNNLAPATLIQGPVRINLMLNAPELVATGVSYTDQAASLIIMRNGTPFRTLPFTATTDAEGFHNSVFLDPDLQTGDVCIIQMAGFKSSAFVFDAAPSPGDVLTVSFDLALGNMNSDNLINAADVALFAADFGKAVGEGKVADFNRDGKVDVKDLYFLGKNME